MDKSLTVAALKSLDELSLTRKERISGIKLRILRRRWQPPEYHNTVPALIEHNDVLIPLRSPVVKNSERWQYWDTATEKIQKGRTLVYKPAPSTTTFFSKVVIPFLKYGNFDDYLKRVKSSNDLVFTDGVDVCHSEVEKFLGTDARTQWLKVEGVVRVLLWLVAQNVTSEPILIHPSYSELELTVNNNFLIYVQRLNRAKLKPRVKSVLGRTIVTLTIPKVPVEF